MNITAKFLSLAAVSAVLGFGVAHPAQAATNLLVNPGFEANNPNLSDPYSIDVDWGASASGIGLGAFRPESGQPNVFGGLFSARSGKGYGILGDARAVNFSQGSVASIFHLFTIPQADTLKFGGYVRLTTNATNPALSIDRAFSEIGIFRDYGDVTVGSRVDFSLKNFTPAQFSPLPDPFGPLGFASTDWFFVEGEWDVKGLAGQSAFFSFDIEDLTPDYRVFVQVDDAFLTAVPESSSLFGLVGLGVVGLGAALKRRKAQSL